MKCELCHEKKGKRGCHRLAGQLICPACCASTRNVECGACSYYQVATAYHQEKRLQSKTVTTEIKPEVDDLCDEALALVEQGKVAQGRTRLEDLLRNHPNYHSVLYALGVCGCMEGDFATAIPHLERAVEIYPLFEHAYYNLGSAYSKTLDLERSVQAYKAVISIDGEYGHVGSQARARIQEFEAMMKASGTTLSAYLLGQKMFDQGFLALQEKKFQAAIGLFAQVLEIQGDHVQSYGNMGLAHAILGHKQKALECLNKAIELDPEYEPAIMNRRAVLAAQEGEQLPDLGFREISYYSEYKLRGKSYIRQLANKLLPNRE